VALIRTLFVVNSSGTSLISTIMVEEHLGQGYYCDDSKSILKRKYGRNVNHQKFHTSMCVANVPHF